MMDSGSYLVEKYNGFYEKYGDGQANCEDDLIALLNAADPSSFILQTNQMRRHYLRHGIFITQASDTALRKC